MGRGEGGREGEVREGRREKGEAKEEERRKEEERGEGAEGGGRELERGRVKREGQVQLSQETDQAPTSHPILQGPSRMNLKAKHSFKV